MVIDDQGGKGTPGIPLAYIVLYDGVLGAFQKIHIDKGILNLQFIQQTPGLFTPYAGAEGIQDNGTDIFSFNMGHFSHKMDSPLFIHYYIPLSHDFFLILP